MRLPPLFRKNKVKPPPSPPRPPAEKKSGPKSGITEKEGEFLRDLAAGVPYGWIVEVGAFQGKSAVSLFEGAKTRRHRLSPDVYSVEPHEEFIGIYGGKFGPEDRRAYYQTMLDTQAYQGVALINLSSEIVSPGWHLPLGMLFIDGDHSYEGVARDVRCWQQHLVPGGAMVFDDSKDPAIGPFHVIAELLATGDYVTAGSAGKITALRKVPRKAAPPPFPPGAKKRILVITAEMCFSGGLLRFERIARTLEEQGHELAFCSLDTRLPEKWSGTAPVLSVKDAWKSRWDVTMLPGVALFDLDRNQKILPMFTEERFGLRVQHLLNDKSRAKAFLQVNQEFLPHVVVFNNDDWVTGDFTAFYGNEFHHLIGGIDVRKFAAIENPIASPESPCVIGGQAAKNPRPLLEAAGLLGDQYRLRLFGDFSPELESEFQELKQSGRLDLAGRLSDEELPAFFATLDLVVTTEATAGWSNLAAEAMASGVPLICTAAGTGAIAIDGETAVLCDDLSPASLAKTISGVWLDLPLRQRLASNARGKIQPFDWVPYTRSLLELTERGRSMQYYHAPDLGLYGKWPPGLRFKGLENILAQLSGKTVLDLGAAEGLISKACLDAGAALVHGLEIDPKRVEEAARLCSQSADSRFYAANLNDAPGIFEQNLLLARYDVVLYLGVHHHLAEARRKSVARHAAHLSTEKLIVRTSPELYESDRLHQLFLDSGFELEHSLDGQRDDLLGALWIYRRAA